MCFVQLMMRFIKCVKHFNLKTSFGNSFQSFVYLFASVINVQDVNEVLYLKSTIYIHGVTESAGVPWGNSCILVRLSELTTYSDGRGGGGHD